MNSRRNFIKNSGIAAMGAGMINQKKKESMNFIHHVLFWAKNPDKKEEVDQLRNAIIELGKLPMIQMVHVGSPVITDFDKPVTEGTYSISVVMVFEDDKKENEYLYSPEHKKFIEDNMHLWGKVMVIDSSTL
ncbi:MAG: hypothetical protein RIR51_294 [Bacteroidota bacterium]|jgi:hypothetical protein